jgi:hypothetical protein
LLVLILAIVVIAVLVFVIAAVAIGRETHRLDAVAPTPTVELNDAVSWISDQLPPEVLAQVSYEDVREVVVAHAETLSERGVVERDTGDGPDVVLDEDVVVDPIMLRLLSQGRDVAPEHVRAIVEQSYAYFEVIGAVGPEAANNDPDTSADGDQGRSTDGDQGSTDGERGSTAGEQERP